MPCFVRVPLALVLLAIAACSTRPGFVDSGSDADVTDVPTIDIGPPDPCADAAPSPQCPICRPSAPACSDDAHGTTRCNADGTAFVPDTTCPAGQLCSNGACVDPCAESARTHSYQGCEFYATNTLNSALGHTLAIQNRNWFPFSVVATNAWPVTAHVMIESRSLGATLTYEVAPHDATRIDLPWILALAEGGDVSNPASALVRGGAFHIRSDIPVAVYQFNPVNYFMFGECEGPQCFSYTNDASLLLPVSTLRRQYMVVTRASIRVRSHDESRWRMSSGFATIVGTVDGTDVTLRLHGRTLAGDGIVAGQVGDTITAHLDAGDVLQVLSNADTRCPNPEPNVDTGDTFCRPDATEDLTGTIVESTAPVAVFSGHDCALVPYNRLACDHLEEQLFPIESLGRRYVVARTPPQTNEPNVLRIVAVRPNTTVTFGPTSVHEPALLVHQGDYVEFEQRDAVEINATDAVLVAQFLVGANYDLTNTIYTNGDPDLVLAVPVDQFRNAYEFVTARDFQATNAIMVVPHGERLLFDGVLLAGPPAATVSDYDVYYRQRLQGPHRVESVHPGIRFGLTVSGLDKFCSYTYPGGLDLTAITLPL